MQSEEQAYFESDVDWDKLVHLKSVLEEFQVKFNFDLLHFLPHVQHIFSTIQQQTESLRKLRIEQFEGKETIKQSLSKSYSDAAREEELTRQMKSLRDQIRAAYISILQLEGIESTPKQLISDIRNSLVRNEEMNNQVNDILNMISVENIEDVSNNDGLEVIDQENGASSMDIIN